MADKRAMFESKINEASKGPGFERVDHGPNFKPGWKASGNSGGGHTGTHSLPPPNPFLPFCLQPGHLLILPSSAHDGKFKKQTKRVETKFEYCSLSLGGGVDLCANWLPCGAHPHQAAAAS
jgi:hypothetical protein